MSMLRMVAWGVVNPDDPSKTKLQRRDILQKVRRELEAHSLVLHVGGKVKDARYGLIDSGYNIAHAWGSLWSTPRGLDALCRFALRTIEKRYIERCHETR